MSDEAGEPVEVAMRRGTTVFYVLAVLTVVEYAIAVGKPPLGLVLLAAIVLAKAGLIVRHFMHGGQLMAMRRR
jgi:cytochrome c oxidase subunit IV